MSEKGKIATMEETATAVSVAPQREAHPGKPKPLPPYKVILHNDDVNTFEHVVITILNLTPLNEQDAITRTIEAHESGCSLLLVTHLERAELYRDQFKSASLTVTIEPAE